MKVNIYYGGRGVLDDPTLHVISKMEQVLLELNVEVHRFNIYENKKEISTLPQTFKDVDGIILATTVEWLGIGGFMNEFLDACWLYGDKEKMKHMYMQPVVMSTTYGEREGMTTLENAWEILGGLPCSGLCGYVEDVSTFEVNAEYSRIIEKKAENLYRTISQKAKGLPTSNQAVRNNVLHTQALNLTPQESEQLSQYVSDDNYVKQQKMDIAELSSMYRNLLGGQMEENAETEYIGTFRSHFVPQADFKAGYSFQIEGKSKPLYIHVDNGDISVIYGEQGPVDVYARVSTGVLNDIIGGRETFQRAFGVGDMTAKGNLRILRMLDTIFVFA
ncbi:MAG: SCP2 sterol-binding domain-containing protein [Lachnospiraceae bacterium]|nr:SCP2 sterol-binding domain-containing protein [Lachnospiraceae bacterium]